MRVRPVARALAYAVGGIAAAVAAPAVAAILVVTNTADTVNGDTSSPRALKANPGADGISLREALLAANNRPGPHTLKFARTLAGRTVVLTMPLPAIRRSGITLAGFTGAQTGKPQVTINGSIGGNNPMLFVGASSFTMSDLQIVVPPQFSALQIGGAIYGSMGQIIRAAQTLSDIRILRNVFRSAGDSTNAFGIALGPSVGLTRNATISNVMIEGNTFSKLFLGVGVGGSGRNNVVSDVVIRRNTFSEMTTHGTSGIEIAGHNGTRNQILRTRILHNVFAGNFIGAGLNHNRDSGPPCKCVDTTTTGNAIDDTLIEGNIFTGNLEAIGISGGVAAEPGYPPTNNRITRTRIVNNVINRTGYQQFKTAAGIHVFDNQDGATDNRVTGLSIINNTINGPGPPGGGVWIESTGSVAGVDVRNTIFWGGSAFGDVAGVPPARVRYSIIDQAGYTGANHNRNVDPLFINAAAGNFRLRAASPARAAGTPNGTPETDLDCQPRNARPSIGAYEGSGPNICPIE